MDEKGGPHMFEHLFSPIKIKSMELKSRAIMPAMGTKFSGNASFVTPTLIEYTKLVFAAVAIEHRRSM